MRRGFAGVKWLAREIRECRGSRDLRKRTVVGENFLGVACSQPLQGRGSSSQMHLRN